MSPAMVISEEARKAAAYDSLENLIYQKGVKHMYENGIQRVPKKYIFPASERPNVIAEKPTNSELELNLPIIDFAELQGPNRSQVLESLAYSCENYGFFQLVNHGISDEITRNMVNVSKRFFEMPLSEREKYMSADMSSPVRYGTSFNQTNDGVFCWRDFLKLVSHPLPDVLPHWPSSPPDFRELVFSYAKETRSLFLMLVEAILESLGGKNDDDDRKKTEEEMLKEMENGSQQIVVNCYPPCPQPDLTLGMPPHSDYGFLTLLLQDDVKGLRIQHQDKWVTVQPIPGSFVVNVGDHLEIFSNKRYKSVSHRVLVNSTNYRVSVASLHSLPFTSTVRPSARLISEVVNHGISDEITKSISKPPFYAALIHMAPSAIALVTLRYQGKTKGLFEENPAPAWCFLVSACVYSLIVGLMEQIQIPEWSRILRRAAVASGVLAIVSLVSIFLPYPMSIVPLITCAALQLVISVWPTLYRVYSLIRERVTSFFDNIHAKVDWGRGCNLEEEADLPV